MRNVRVRPPAFLSNLYRDLRDRRLLLPAVALLVAVVAVPILVSSSSTSAPPPAAPVANTGKATAAEPAVVTEQLGVTNYRKRLEQFKSKNPFRAQFTVPKVTNEVQRASVSAPATSTTETTTSGTTSGTTSSTSSSSGTSLPAEPSLGTSSPAHTSTSPPAPEPPTPTFRLYTYRLHVRVGLPGDLADRPSVRRLTALPSQQKPLVTFLSVSERGGAALFVVSDDVESVTGNGRCAPTHTKCQYLVMQPGDNASMVYTPSGETYKLRLIDIHPAVIANKPPETQNKSARPKSSTPVSESADRFGPSPRD
jgi:hypothetical protein